jgi:hypothetical protein
MAAATADAETRGRGDAVTMAKRVRGSGLGVPGSGLRVRGSGLLGRRGRALARIPLATRLLSVRFERGPSLVSSRACGNGQGVGPSVETVIAESKSGGKPVPVRATRPSLATQPRDVRSAVHRLERSIIMESGPSRRSTAGRVRLPASWVGSSSRRTALSGRKTIGTMSLVHPHGHEFGECTE